MLTIISGNSRSGYPYALNKVDDIFQCGIPPFQTEGLIDLGYASQKEGLSLAGSLRKIFCSVNVTASDSPGVTVSMTSEDSVGYANLSSPKLGSAKSHQRHSSMQGGTVTSRNTINGLASVNVGGLRTDNLLNIKTESAFVQTEDKEKGPRPALRVMQLLTCEEANELHHNLPLQATANLSYSRHQHLKKTGAGFSRLNTEADISRFKKRFFCVRDPRYAPIMVRRNGGASALAGFFCASRLTSIRLATPFSRGLVRLQNLTEEATAMVATTQTRPEFIDTYWIIPEYETTPYGKVSFTRKDRRTFIALFKDSRLIWAGRQPVKCFNQDVKRTESQKVDVKRSLNPTSSVKGTESRSQFNQSPGLLVRKMSHEGIGEISIPQGGVNITPPSTPTITNIVTVPATVSDIATVQGVAHV